MSFDLCKWCEGTGIVQMFRKGYQGSAIMIVEDLDYRTGELATRRVPGSVAIHCRECPKGEERYLCFADEQRRKLWTTRHVLSQSRNYLKDNYLIFDPSYTEEFETFEEAIRWASNLGELTNALPDLPRPHRSTPERLQRQARNLAASSVAAAPSISPAH